MTSTPSPARERVYRFVRDRLMAGEPPSVREVRDAMGFAAVESARKHLETLVAEGRLVKVAGRARGYRLPSDEPGGCGPGVLVPLVGGVQAGELRAAIEEPEGYVLVQPEVASEAVAHDAWAEGDGSDRRDHRRLFALRVRGDSMVGGGILDGDIVVVRRQDRAEVGQIVVARIGDEATVKTLGAAGRRVVLEPANPDYRPIEADRDEVEILGCVVEVRRRLD